MSGVYLSIDLDYWWEEPDTYEADKFFDRVFKVAAKKKLKIPLVGSHEKLLPYINRSGCSTICNVDYHSDIVADNDANLQLDCGTWGNFVKHKQDKKFIWICPDISICGYYGYGYCHWIEKDDPFKPDRTKYQSVTKCDKLSRIKWNEVEAIGVCASVEWWCYDGVWSVLEHFGLTEKQILGLDDPEMEATLPESKRLYDKAGLWGNWKG